VSYHPNSPQITPLTASTDKEAHGRPSVSGTRSTSERIIRPQKTTTTLRSESASEISLNTVKHGRKSDDARKPSTVSGADSQDPVSEDSDVSPTTPSLSQSLAAQQGAVVSDAFPRRANRFWTYIGPQHMARNPHLYSAEELQRFAGDLASDLTLTEEGTGARGEVAELEAGPVVVEGVHGGIPIR